MNPRELAGAIFRAGVPIIQLRAKGATDDELRVWSADFAVAAVEHDALFVVNDRVDIALEVGADGVHLGPNDMSIAQARERSADLIIGGSAGDVRRARKLVEQGVDYLGCGAIWNATASKENASEARGLEMIREISSAVSVPIVGIGGVTLERAPRVRKAGAAGVAVIRAIAGQPDPGVAAAAFVEVMTR
jgi:thiamine-phosphate pyrophosphorylase